MIRKKNMYSRRAPGLKTAAIRSNLCGDMNAVFRLFTAVLFLWLIVPGRMGEVSGLEQMGKARPVNQPRVKKPLRKPVIPPPVEAEKAATEPASTNDAPARSQGPRIVNLINYSGYSGEELGQIRALYVRMTAADQFQPGGKVTTVPEDALKKLRAALTDTCPMLFASQQRADGGKLHLYQYGVNAALRPEVAQKLGGTAWTPEEAHALAQDFARLLQIQGTLSSQELDGAARANLQNEFDDLLNKYFAIQAKNPKDPRP